MSLNNPANPLKVSGGSAVSFDDTMTESNGVYSVTRPVHPILTQAEYDALPEAEKNKGVYVVSDGEDAGEESGSTGPGEVYSEEETVIGTFLGKPLYRRVIRMTIPSGINASTSSELLHVSIPVDNIRTLEASVKAQSGQWCSVPYYITADDICWVAYNEPNHRIAPNSIRIIGSTNQVGRTIVITMEYTKTTD